MTSALLIRRQTIGILAREVRASYRTIHSSPVAQASDPRIDDLDLGHEYRNEFAALRDKYATHPATNTHAITTDKPKYPIVLAHGLFGFDELRLAGPYLPGLQYWRGVRDALEANGIEVITTAVSPSGSIEERGKKLAEVIAAHPAVKVAEGREGGRGVNIIAGLDSRYMISQLRPRNVDVKSLTTIATPHRGSAFADWMMDQIGADNLPRAYSVLKFCRLETGAFAQLTRKYMQEEFNPRTPDREGVKYYSYGATLEPERWSSFKQLHDLVAILENAPNDGLVSVPSSKWGTYKGTISGVSHLDLINWTSRVKWMLYSLVGYKPTFNAIAFYLDICDADKLSPCSSSLHAPERAAPLLDADVENNEIPRHGNSHLRIGGARRVACPFTKKFPLMQPIDSSCLFGFTCTARLKEHLYRRHRLPDRHCHLCYEGFEDHETLYKHLWTQQGGSQCSGSGRTPDMYMLKPQERQLKMRHRRVCSEEEKWRNIYCILFQNEENTLNSIPSPFIDDYSPVVTNPHHQYRHGATNHPPVSPETERRVQADDFHHFGQQPGRRRMIQNFVEAEHIDNGYKNLVDQRRKHFLLEASVHVNSEAVPTSQPSDPADFSSPDADMKRSSKEKYAPQTYELGHAWKATYSCPAIACNRRGIEAFYPEDELQAHLQRAHSRDDLCACPAFNCSIQTLPLDLMLIHVSSHESNQLSQSLTALQHHRPSQCPLDQCSSCLGADTAQLSNHVLSHTEEDRSKAQLKLSMAGYNHLTGNPICPICHLESAPDLFARHVHDQHLMKPGSSESSDVSLAFEHRRQILWLYPGFSNHFIFDDLREPRGALQMPSDSTLTCKSPFGWGCDLDSALGESIVSEEGYTWNGFFTNLATILPGSSASENCWEHSSAITDGNISDETDQGAPEEQVSAKDGNALNVVHELLASRENSFVALLTSKIKERLGYDEDSNYSETSSDDSTSTGESFIAIVACQEGNEENSRADESATLRSTRFSSSEKGKKRTTSGIGADEENDESQGRDLKRKRTNSPADTSKNSQKRFACQYRKRFPRIPGLAPSCSHGFSTPGRVKEHLSRRHALREIHCPECFEEFQNLEGLARHLRPSASGQSGCPGHRPRPEYKFGSEERKALEPKQRKNLPDVEKWKVMWRIVFPDAIAQQDIPCPYMDGEDDYTAAQYSHIMQNRLPEILHERVRGLLDMERGILEARAESIIDRVLPEIIRSIREELDHEREPQPFRRDGMEPPVSRILAADSNTVATLVQLPEVTENTVMPSSQRANGTGDGSSSNINRIGKHNLTIARSCIGEASDSGYQSGSFDIQASDTQNLHQSDSPSRLEQNEEPSTTGISSGTMHDVSITADVSRNASFEPFLAPEPSLLDTPEVNGPEFPQNSQGRGGYPMPQLLGPLVDTADSGEQPPGPDFPFFDFDPDLGTFGFTSQGENEPFSFDDFFFDSTEDFNLITQDSQNGNPGLSHSFRQPPLRGGESSAAAQLGPGSPSITGLDNPSPD
ncbi:triacylglycerol lipase [Diplodia corticola]|uniref:Triacylglycerol lipase n=1 Tax=Diplodia corticola TaxID=236234 RepID=A0A1J9RKB2_9PEZI|nr:triacylglycerol lipase [Diplodia corticola]OJD28959.1 triacylglycerol lipase [Diplodia corticola]